MAAVKTKTKGPLRIPFGQVVRKKICLRTPVSLKMVDSERYRRADEYAKRVVRDTKVNVRQANVTAHGFNEKCLRVSAKAKGARVTIPTGTIFHTGTKMQNLAVVQGYTGVVEPGKDLVLDAFCMDPGYACPHGPSRPTGLKVNQKNANMDSFSQGSFWKWMMPCNPGFLRGVTSCQDLWKSGRTNDQKVSSDESDSDSDSSSDDSDYDTDSDDDRPMTSKRRSRKRRKALKKLMKGRYKTVGKVGKKKRKRYVCPRDGRVKPRYSRKNDT